MEKKNFMENMLRLLPYWHYKIDKPFKLFLKDKITLETYYCLQIIRQNGPMTMSELARYLKISKQQATKMIETLYKYDFVERKYSETDRRLITISVTDTAINYIEQHIYQDTDLLDSLQDKLGKEDAKQLEKAVETLLDILPKLD